MNGRCLLSSIAESFFGMNVVHRAPSRGSYLGCYAVPSDYVGVIVTRAPCEMSVFSLSNIQRYVVGYSIQSECTAVTPLVRRTGLYTSLIANMQ